MSQLLSLSAASDIANAVLKFYAPGKTLLQTMQDMPLVGFLQSGQKTFPGGTSLSDPVQGSVMEDTAGFLQGYTEDQLITFATAANILRCDYSWYEVAAGLVITWTELKKDGITITDGGGRREHGNMALTQLTSLFENRMDDFGESWARAFNKMLWKDGSQDSLQCPGVLSILTDTPTTGLTGGLNRATYTWWRHRTKLDLVPSETDQNIAKFFRSEYRQLKRHE